MLPFFCASLQGFLLHSPRKVFTEGGLSFQVLEVIAWLPVHMNGFDVLVGIEIVHGFGSLTFESGVELTHFGEVNLVALGHLLRHGFGNGGDDSLVVAFPEGGTMKGDIVQEFVYRQGLLILCAGIDFLVALGITWVSTLNEGVFHIGCSF